MSDYDRIPAELCALPQWVCWRTVSRGGKNTHLPINARTGELASTTDATTWSSYEQATKAVADTGVGGTPVYGIGYVFSASDGYTGIDLDSKEVTSAQLADMQRIVTAFDSYTEVSPSGLGVHVIIKGKLVQAAPDDATTVSNEGVVVSQTVGSGLRRNGVEIYSAGRYFRFTGNIYLDRPIASRQALLDMLVKQMRPSRIANALLATRPQVDNDDVVVEQMLGASNGDKIRQLVHGDGSSILGTDRSGSAIDMAIVNTIQFYTKNAAQIERIWLSTPHAQSRQHKMARADYRLATIQRSFDLTVDIDLQGIIDRGAAGSATLVSVETGGIATTPGNGSGATASLPAAPKRIRKRRKPVNPYVPPTGLLGDLAQWIYAQAPRPVAEIALAGAIGWMAGVGGKAFNVSGAGLNVYLALLASSGGGKEAISLAYGKIQAALAAAGAPAVSSFFGPGDFASVPGLIKAVEAKRSSISLITEFGLWLEEMIGQRASPQRAAIRKTLLALYSKSGAKAEYYETAYSDKTNTIPKITAPALSLLGETTPSTFYRSITQATIEDGFLPRFMIVEYTGPAPHMNYDAASVQLPDDLRNRLFAFVEHCLRLNSPVAQAITAGSTAINLTPGLLDQLHGPLHVEFTPECREAAYQFNRYCTDQLNETDIEGVKNLWARVWLNTAKLAALAAVGVNHHRPQIGLEQWNWAHDIVTHSMGLIVDKVEDGEIAADSESIQWNDFKRCLAEVQHYTDERCVAYKMNAAMRDNAIVNTAWMSMRISRLASFRTDRNGAAAALKRVLQRAIDEEILRAGVLFVGKVQGGGKLYQIMST